MSRKIWCGMGAVMIAAGLLGCDPMARDGEEYGGDTTPQESVNPSAEENAMRDNIPPGEAAGTDADTNDTYTTPGALPPTDGSGGVPGAIGTPGSPPAGSTGPEGQLPPNERLPREAGRIASPNNDASAGVPPAPGSPGATPPAPDGSGTPPAPDPENVLPAAPAE